MLVCCANVKPSYFLMPPWFWYAIFVSHFAWWQRTWWSPSCWFKGVENLTDRFDGYLHRAGWRKCFCGCFPKQPFGAVSSQTLLYRENRSSLLILERCKMFAKLPRVSIFFISLWAFFHTRVHFVFQRSHSSWVLRFLFQSYYCQACNFYSLKAFYLRNFDLWHVIYS